MAGYGTLLEVRRQWSLDDLMDCHELLDIRDDAEDEAMQKAKGR